MLNKTKLSFLLIFSLLVVFSTIATSLDRSNEKIISSNEIKQMSELRNKMNQAKAIEGQNVLKKVEKSILKQYKQSPSQIMGMIQLKANSINSNHPQKNHLNDPMILKDQSLVNPNSNRDCDAG